MTNPANPRRGGSPVADAVSDSPDGILVTHMLIVSDLGRSVAFYRDVLGATVERENPPAMLRLYNAWLVLNVGGGPTDDKPRVTVTTPTDPTIVSSFLNIRVADIESVHALWSSRSAHCITPPIDRGAEIRCYLHDPDGHLIELGQTTMGAESHQR
jgi:catechol 2,3-dioxygenase-like lactoylglutathione lyase family enzyme